MPCSISRQNIDKTAVLYGWNVIAAKFNSAKILIHIQELYTGE